MPYQTRHNPLQVDVPPTRSSRLSALLLSMLDAGPFPSKSALAYRAAVALAALAGTALRVIATLDEGGAMGGGWSAWGIEMGVVMVLTADLCLQAGAMVTLRAAGMPAGTALRRYLTSRYGLIDLLAVLPFMVNALIPLPADWLTVLGVARMLKLARYSPALETLGSVIRREARPLQSALFIIVLLMITASTAQYLAERHANPGAFGSIPQAMWWGVVTLTTLGYGDVVPITPWGKLLGGVTALLGVGMFALPASILATGFAEEMRRRDFLATWRLVARVPFFARLDAQHIADITLLLKFYTAGPGDVLMRTGELGDRMFFILDGSVEVDFGGSQPALLHDGDFFGEIALLHNSPRTATVRTRGRCHLLMLDAKDFRRFLAGTPAVAEIITRTAQRRLSEQMELADPVV